MGAMGPLGQWLVGTPPIPAHRDRAVGVLAGHRPKAEAGGVTMGDRLSEIERLAEKTRTNDLGIFHGELIAIARALEADLAHLQANRLDNLDLIKQRDKALIDLAEARKQAEVAGDLTESAHAALEEGRRIIHAMGESSPDPEEWMMRVQAVIAWGKDAPVGRCTRAEKAESEAARLREELANLQELKIEGVAKIVDGSLRQMARVEHERSERLEKERDALRAALERGIKEHEKSFGKDHDMKICFIKWVYEALSPPPATECDCADVTVPMGRTLSGKPFSLTCPVHAPSGTAKAVGDGSGGVVPGKAVSGQAAAEKPESRCAYVYANRIRCGASEERHARATRACTTLTRPLPPPRRGSATALAWSASLPMRPAGWI